MDRFIKKWSSKSTLNNSTSQNSPLHQESENQVGSSSSEKNTPNQPPSMRSSVDLNTLPADPAERKPILNYHPNDCDEVRRAYIQKGPYQPQNHNFPQSNFSGAMRRFNPSWFDNDLYKNWLEYSIKEDAAFCLCCYLFKNENLGRGGGDVFSTKGFRGWNRIERFGLHIGGPSSPHNQCYKKSEDLMMQKQSIQTVLDKQSQQAKSEYRTRLNASIDVARLLLICGLPFRGHDEGEFSKRKGNFLTLLKWYAERVENVGDVVLKNAPKNLQLTSPKIQKDIVNACAKETVISIIEDIGDEYFAILVDESRDVAHKEQMALVLRYVDKKGIIMERLVGLVHVTDTSALSLKEAIYSLLSQHSLSPCRIRGQGYDGASNMQGHLNGLKTLIMRDSKSAHCIHCFAHQLQLTLVAVAKNHDDIEWLFELIAIVLNVIGASFKHRDMLREKQAEKIQEALRVGELESGRGLNQELGLKRAGDTCWGSHFKSLLNLITMFSSVIDVIDAIANDGLRSNDRIKAQGLLDALHSFEFAFILHLIKEVMGITNELNISLQRREQDIVNAMSLLSTTKSRLQKMRDDGWDGLIVEVTSFCVKHDIEILDMNHMHVLREKSKRRVSEVTNEHYYRVNVLYTIIDMQLQELNNRFNEVNTELMLGVACLNPVDSFSNFDKSKLLNMAKFYPDDFDGEASIKELDIQLDNFVENVRHDSRFSNLKGISDLSRKLVETKKHWNFPRVFLLLKLALILPVATATVERAFSGMKYIKSDLRNRMGDELLSDSLITYVENDVFENVTNDAIMYRFQNMKTRRGQL